jgi:hypothetical protein
MGVMPGRVSQIERGELATIDAVARYVEALRGRLDLIASFGDHTLIVSTTDQFQATGIVAAGGHTVTDDEPRRHSVSHRARP